jgi:uncharacterized protein (TIGR03435 family)
MRRIALTVMLGFALISVALLPLRAQSPGEKLSFEVASVRAVSPARGVGGRGGSGVAACGGGGNGPPQVEPQRFAATASLYTFIAWAYGKRCITLEAQDLLSGGPEWIKSDPFAVQALIPQGSPSYTRDQFMEGNAPRLQMMIQSLLADRFKLVLHNETKDMPIYSLTVAKNGAKLQSFKEGSCDPAPPPPPFKPGQTRPCGRGVGIKNNTTLSVGGNGINLNEFSQFLSLAA